MMKYLLVLPAALCLAAVSCTNSGISSGGSGLKAYTNYDLPASLPSNPSAVRVKVSIKNQMVYVMEGSKALMVMPVAVGTTSTPTPGGTFRIFKKEHRHRANSHGWAYSGEQSRKTYIDKKPSGWSFKGTPMPYWCEFKANYGFHTGWMKPYPCTHGCLRMHENVAPKFYRLVKTGTQVQIATTQPEDATIGRNIPRPPDAGPLPDYPGSFYLGDGYFTKHKAPAYR
jgi:hypothetical protein